MNTISQTLARTAAVAAPPQSRVHSVARSEAAGSATSVSAGLALLRLIVGTVFVAHGAQKLFVFGLAGVTAAFEGMGVPFAAITAPAVALVELLGGLALIAGLLTRWAGLGLAVTMVGAIFLAHLSGGFFMPNGIEFVLTLFGAAVALALTGAGRYSLDAVLARRGVR